MLVAGCASVQVPLEHIEAVSLNRIETPQLLAPDDKRTVPLVIRRDLALHSWGSGALLRLDGELVARVHAGEELRIYLAPGDYVLTADMPGTLWGPSSFRIKLPSAMKHMRIMVDLLSGPRLEPAFSDPSPVPPSRRIVGPKD